MYSPSASGSHRPDFIELFACEKIVLESWVTAKLAVVPNFQKPQHGQPQGKKTLGSYAMLTGHGLPEFRSSHSGARATLFLRNLVVEARKRTLQNHNQEQASCAGGKAQSDSASATSSLFLYYGFAVFVYSEVWDHDLEKKTKDNK